VTLAGRYGNTPARLFRTRWLFIGLGAFIAVVMIVWAVWVGLAPSATSLTGAVGGTQIVNDHEVSVSVTVHAPAGTGVSCGIEAQNLAFTVVGYQVVDMPMGSATTRSVTVAVTTYEKPVAASLDTCWVN
jgi:hypothetical protein